jgi:hypothetical protein
MSTGNQTGWGEVVPEYFVRVESSDSELGVSHESAEKAYASSAAEAEKIVEARHEAHGINTNYFEYTAHEVSEDGTIQGL